MTLPADDRIRTRLTQLLNTPEEELVSVLESMLRVVNAAEDLDKVVRASDERAGHTSAQQISRGYYIKGEHLARIRLALFELSYE